MLKGAPAATKPRLRGGVLALSALAAALALALPAAASAVRLAHHGNRVARVAAGGGVGELDCNGHSPLQHALRATMNCTDIRGFRKSNANTWNGRFYDNGYYIGHDEPDMTFLSRQSGTGNDVTWSETLPMDPTAAPTVAHPGADVSHWFELSVAPWFSMAMCDSNSYPQAPCTPQSDSNAPTKTFNGGGSAFMEAQFYPPGFAPFADSTSCDNTHWCSALTIDSLECTQGFASCNTGCEEPINFAFIQTNGVPTGPPSPQQANLASFTQNSHTLLMNPGDRIQVHMFNAPVPGGGGASAFEVRIMDFTTGQTGFMQASAANGFMHTSMADCSGTPYNYQPEYNTASKNNIIPWAALRTNISTQFETGHWTPCTSITGPGTMVISPTITDKFWNVCHSPYEKTSDSGTPEPTDGPCYHQGDTHGALNSAPDTMTGCTDTLGGGDLDFDGSPYWPEWPIGPQPTQGLPGSFVQALPVSAGTQYSQFFMQTDLALSESTCSGTTTQGCHVPPGNAPGHFYPYWSRVKTNHGCVIEFGNVSAGAWVNDFGGVKQYGTDQVATLGYPEFLGPVMNNACPNGTAS